MTIFAILIFLEWEEEIISFQMKMMMKLSLLLVLYPLISLDRDYFRRKLVENFSIKLSRGDVYWPRSARNQHVE